MAITVWQVARANSQRDRYRNLSRRRRREGNHGGMNWKENCRPEGDRGALSHVGKKLLSVTFFASFCTRSKGNSVVVASSEFEISRALGLAEMVVELVRENSPPLLQSEFRCFFPSPPFSTNAESNSISSDVWTFPRHLYEISLFRVCIGQRGEDIFPSFSYPLNNEWTDKWMKSRMF